MMIKVQEDGGCWTLTLARPEKANALTAAMLQDLRDALNNAASAGGKVVILTGEGRVFSAGADLAEMVQGLGKNPLWEVVTSALASFPGLTIAALNGTLAGGATGLALACDVRIAVPGAEVFYPVMRLGYLPQPSDPARLTALIGPGRARMLLLAGQRIGADEALAWGLIDRIVPPSSLIDSARALAADALAAEHSHVTRLVSMARDISPGRGRHDQKPD